MASARPVCTSAILCLASGLRSSEASSAHSKMFAVMFKLSKVTANASANKLVNMAYVLCS
ncbi:hypothetical protein I1H34_31595 (plasmid) [Acaryochloris marina S15]|nr:hypothetical protein I1H34_31595 [Acaryochloris marina S15]